MEAKAGKSPFRALARSGRNRIGKKVSTRPVAEIDNFVSESSVEASDAERSATPLAGVRKKVPKRTSRRKTTLARIKKFMGLTSEPNSSDDEVDPASTMRRALAQAAASLQPDEGVCEFIDQICEGSNIEELQEDFLRAPTRKGDEKLVLSHMSSFVQAVSSTACQCAERIVRKQRIDADEALQRAKTAERQCREMQTEYLKEITHLRDRIRKMPEGELPTVGVVVCDPLRHVESSTAGLVRALVDECVKALISDTKSAGQGDSVLAGVVQKWLEAERKRDADFVAKTEFAMMALTEQMQVMCTKLRDMLQRCNENPNDVSWIRSALREAADEVEVCVQQSSPERPSSERAPSKTPPTSVPADRPQVPVVASKPRTVEMAVQAELPPKQAPAKPSPPPPAPVKVSQMQQTDPVPKPATKDQGLQTTAEGLPTIQVPQVLPPVSPVPTPTARSQAFPDDGSSPMDSQSKMELPAVSGGDVLVGRSQTDLSFVKTFTDGDVRYGTRTSFKSTEGIRAQISPRSTSGTFLPGALPPVGSALPPERISFPKMNRPRQRIKRDSEPSSGPGSRVQSNTSNIEFFSPFPGKKAETQDTTRGAVDVRHAVTAAARERRRSLMEARRTSALSD